MTGYLFLENGGADNIEFCMAPSRAANI